MISLLVIYNTSDKHLGKFNYKVIEYKNIIKKLNIIKIKSSKHIHVRKFNY